MIPGGRLYGILRPSGVVWIHSGSRPYIQHGHAGRPWICTRHDVAELLASLHYKGFKPFYREEV
jgi:hypothetical protein